MIKHTVLEGKPVIHSEYLDSDIYDLNTQTFVIPRDFSYRVIEVSEGFVARPDLVSQACYQNNIYGDIICKLNGISNPFELAEGMLLIIPELAYLDKFKYRETPAEANISDNSAPKPKMKKDKRKANEAVVGDVRFKIDNNNKIIIY